MKVAILCGQSILYFVEEIVGMRTDGSHAGLNSTAQFDSSHRNLENVTLVGFNDSHYTASNFADTLVKWIASQQSIQSLPVAIFYYVPQGPRIPKIKLEGVGLYHFRSRVHLEKQFSRYVVKMGWSIVQKTRMER